MPTYFRAVAQLGSALDWGSRGRRFKSCQPDAYGGTRWGATIFLDFHHLAS